MATYLETYNLAFNEDFRKRVQTAALIVARDLLNDGAEDQTGPRYVLARQASRLDAPVVDQFAWEAALNPSIADKEKKPGSSADSDIGYVCASIWDRVAGA